MRRSTKALAAGAAATAMAAGAAVLINNRLRQEGRLDKVRRNKFDRWFDTLDVDGNEFITEQDLLRAADRVLTARDVPVDSPMGLELRDATLQLWTDFIASGDTDEDGRVGRRELHSALAQNMLSDRIAAGAKLASVADAYFAITDADGDGLISSSEFVQLLRNWNGVDYQESHRLFEILDADHDNRISPDEWRGAIFGFFLSPARDCPANNLMGKVGTPIMVPIGSLRARGDLSDRCEAGSGRSPLVVVPSAPRNPAPPRVLDRPPGASPPVPRFRTPLAPEP
ncbi:EF-hand domain-containing protein [Glycomyces sp. TRM65418]|uniref:EF-hand domain-containing protein n=1 Tax=Glycomyces sp. TRM65418 TaxID=2867006 RepID=UPI001CE5D192|nr:EF-hand domain-containing protein [Glycomyces sp. TRM65418]MCC3763981.1 EF-hand domain-containing protein [Glycomyces sp. TRM65418]QZD53677.1 EF-hand domain-containing protein [Glycomyces sp. TRM65418]